MDEIHLSLEKLQAAKDELQKPQPEKKRREIEIYREKRDLYGYAEAYLFTADIEVALLQELADLGVPVESIEFLEQGPGSDGIRIRFQLEGRVREIEWIAVDLLNLPDALKEKMKGSADVYYQRASQTLPSFYQRYLYAVSRWVKPGGLLLLNDVTSGNDFANSGEALGWIDFKPLRNAAVLQTEGELENALGITEDSPASAFYGWKMSLWQNIPRPDETRSEVRQLDQKTGSIPVPSSAAGAGRVKAPIYVTDSLKVNLD